MGSHRRPHIHCVLVHILALIALGAGTLSSPFAAAEKQCSRAISGLQFVGSELLEELHAPLDHCCQHCTITPRCYKWSWSQSVSKGGRCTLFGSGNAELESVGPMEGVFVAWVYESDAARRYSKPQCPFQLSGIDFEGSDIGQERSDHADECCEKCKMCPGCSFWTWSDFEGGTCWLKNSEGVPATKHGLLSGFLLERQIVERREKVTFPLSRHDKAHGGASSSSSSSASLRADKKGSWQSSVARGIYSLLPFQSSLYQSHLAKRPEEDVGMMTHEDYVEKAEGLTAFEHRISDQKAEQLKGLELRGIRYLPHGVAYGVKYLGQNPTMSGDCMFQSLEAILKSVRYPRKLTAWNLRMIAIDTFWRTYRSSSTEEKAKMDKAVENFYFPDVSTGWGVSPQQTRRYLVGNEDSVFCPSKINDLYRKGMQYLDASKLIYEDVGVPINSVKRWKHYMTLGPAVHFKDYMVVDMHYSYGKLVGIEADQLFKKVTWGDDFALEALATAFKRDIYVVLMDPKETDATAEPFTFLPHRPMKSKGNPPLVKDIIGHRAPWFLLMLLAKNEARGGFHYEPMVATTLPLFAEGTTEASSAVEGEEPLYDIGGFDDNVQDSTST